MKADVRWRLSDQSQVGCDSFNLIHLELWIVFLCIAESMLNKTPTIQATCRVEDIVVSNILSIVHKFGTGTMQSCV